jgi:ribosome-associated protein
MDVTTGRRTGERIVRDVLLTTEPVELFKILKFEGLVPSGAAAKLAIESGGVMVNGFVETRKRRKMLAGDTIEYEGEVMQLRVED